MCYKNYMNVIQCYNAPFELLQPLSFVFFRFTYHDPAQPSSVAVASINQDQGVLVSPVWGMVEELMVTVWGMPSAVEVAVGFAASTTAMGSVCITYLQTVHSLCRLPASFSVAGLSTIQPPAVWAAISVFAPSPALHSCQWLVLSNFQSVPKLCPVASPTVKVPSKLVPAEETPQTQDV